MWGTHVSTCARYDTGPEDVFESMGLGHVVKSATEERVPLGDDESLPGAHIVIQQTAGKVVHTRFIYYITLLVVGGSTLASFV